MLVSTPQISSPLLIGWLVREQLELREVLMLGLVLEDINESLLVSVTHL